MWMEKGDFSRTLAFALEEYAMEKDREFPHKSTAWNTVDSDVSTSLRVKYMELKILRTVTTKQWCCKDNLLYKSRFRQL